MEQKQKSMPTKPHFKCIECEENHPEVVLHFDGGIRSGVCAYGWIMTLPNDETHVVAYGCRICGTGSSNIAEYCALLAGLSACKRMGIKIVHIFGDSQLVIRQVTGKYKVSKGSLVKLCNRIQKMLAEELSSYTIMWIPRNQNKQADALVNKVFTERYGKCKKRNM